MGETATGPGGRGARRARIAALCCLAAFVAFSHCRAPETAKPPNVIFLTVDTLRADHMALYGYERNTMPSVERFADSGIVFENAVVPRGATRPSYASMLTGLYPFRHGVQDNHTVLHPDLTTLQERLKAGGYQTAGFVSNFVLLGEMSGLNQGFDLYDDFVGERKRETDNFERKASDTLASILAWLDSGPREPFFLFTNFIDPHGPYQPPAHLEGLFQSDEERLLAPDQIPEYQRHGEERNLYDYIDRYDEEVRYADSALGILLSELKARGLTRNSVIVFTADHGEAFGEHGLFFEHHWHLWEETNRVPLIIQLPGSDPGPRAEGRVRTVSSPLDLYPTILDILGLELPEGMDGRSLLPFLRGEEDPQRLLFLEYPNVESPPGHVPSWFSVRAATHSMVRIVEDVSGKMLMEAVFDLRQDPLQQDPSPPDQLDPMQRAMHRTLTKTIEEALGWEHPFTITRYELPPEDRDRMIENRRNRPGVEVRTLTPEQVEKLRSLGYAE